MSTPRDRYLSSAYTAPRDRALETWMTELAADIADYEEGVEE